MLPVQILQMHVIEENDERERFRLYNDQRRFLRDTSDPLGLPDISFIQLFRLTKDMYIYLYQRLYPYINVGANARSIRADLKLLTALSFYATGTYQRPIGQNFSLAMSQPAVCQCIHEITELICTHLANEWIRFPTDQVIINQNKRKFFENTGFPGVIGAIDCTHVAIIAPQEEEHNYLNRKGFHSKNIQIICDYDLRILNINPRYAGATHDAYIWRLSSIKREMERRYRAGDHDTWLIGDSGYPQEPWLMIPINDPLPNTPEYMYTHTLTRARSCIERCNGQLKMKFRCLLGERVLRYNPQEVGRFSVACSVLHNICVDARLPYYAAEIDGIAEQNQIQFGEIFDNINGNLEGQYARTRVIQQFFQ